MGKKGKKKEKIEGTPDVVKFKGTRDFHALRECVNMQDQLPFVSSDPLDEASLKKVARFLNLVGILAQSLEVDSDKRHRFIYHHKFMCPAPQLHPTGYKAELIKRTRTFLEHSPPVVNYNGVTYPLRTDLEVLGKEFLKEVDSHMTKFASFVEPSLKEHFASGLRAFLKKTKTSLSNFDTMWSNYEQVYMKELHLIHEEVFKPIDNLFALEKQVTDCENRVDYENKVLCEHQLVSALEKFINVLFPNTADVQFPDDVIALAESCVFYESKCKPEWISKAMRVMNDYLEVRTFIVKIPETRIHPQHHDNFQFIRLLKSFHAAVLGSNEVWDFVKTLPRVRCKLLWMSRQWVPGILKEVPENAGLKEQMAAFADVTLTERG